MELFVSDLDNTLIYSYKRELGREKVLVERKEGKELSFMTGLSHRMLAETVKAYCFVPATTRSLEQYRRVSFFPGFVPQYALTANGGVLLKNGELSQEWYRESQELCRESEVSLQEAEALLSRDPAVSFEIRRVDGLFVFTKSDDVGATAARLKEILEPDAVEVLNNGSKVYVIPRRLSKGTALRRLRALTKAERIFAAGDSEFDLSMIREADEAWIPENLLKDWSRGGTAGIDAGVTLRIVPEGEIFSDRLLSDLTSAARNGVEGSGQRGAVRDGYGVADAAPCGKEMRRNESDGGTDR